MLFTPLMLLKKMYSVDSIMQNTDQAPINQELVSGSDKLFLFFGGISGGIGMPPFEFYRSSQILNYSKIFLRDLNQSWYQRGLPAIGDDVHSIGEYLKQIIRDSGAREVRFIGNSMGGFAALLFCAMLKCGKVIAFAPQTFVSHEKRLVYGDRRWASQIKKLHETKQESDIYDLKPWIQSRYPAMEGIVYVSELDILDMLHANELKAFSNIKIHTFPNSGHGLVAKLRNDGSLEKIINS